MMKLHKRSTLMNWTRRELVDHIMMLEHNNQVMEETFEQQYKNCMQIIRDMDIFNKTYKEGMVNIMGYKNCEGYSDPTAGAAISATAKEEQEVEKLNHKVIQSFRLLVDLAGFEIVGRVTLKHKKTGKIFK